MFFFLADPWFQTICTLIADISTSVLHSLGSFLSLFLILRMKPLPSISRFFFSPQFSSLLLVPKGRQRALNQIQLLQLLFPSPQQFLQFSLSQSPFNKMKPTKHLLLPLLRVNKAFIAYLVEWHHFTCILRKSTIASSPERNNTQH